MPEEYCNVIIVWLGKNSNVIATKKYSTLYENRVHTIPKGAVAGFVQERSGIFVSKCGTGQVTFKLSFTPQKRQGIAEQVQCAVNGSFPICKKQGSGGKSVQYSHFELLAVS